MKCSRIHSGRTASIPAGLVWGLSVSMCSTILCTFIIAYLLEREKMIWETVGYGVMIMLILSSYAGARVSWIKIRHQKFMVCMLSGILYYATLLILTALFFYGQYEAAGVTFLLVATGCCAAALLGDQKNKRSDSGSMGRGGMKLYK